MVKIKLLKFLSCINSSVQDTGSLGVARKATEGIKKRKEKRVAGVWLGYYPFFYTESRYSKLYRDTRQLGARYS